MDMSKRRQKKKKKKLCTAYQTTRNNKKKLHVEDREGPEEHEKRSNLTNTHHKP